MKKTKYRIWDKGVLVNAYCRKPKNLQVLELKFRTLDEIKKGIKYYIPSTQQEVGK